MGVKRELRIAHEKKIKKFAAELDELDRRIANERRLAGEMERAIAELAFDAAGGDRRKLSEQAALNAKKAEYLLQVQNLEQLAAPIRQAIAAAEVELSRYSLEEAHERVIESISDLPAMANKLSAMVEPVAIAFGEFKKRLDAAAQQALPLISRGDSERARRLADRLRTVIFRGMRAQMASDFHTHKVDFFTGEPFEASTFDGVVRPALAMMAEALAVDIYADGVRTPGRAQFRCTTNVSGLFGLFLRVGEVVSLPVDNENVKTSIALGALELVGEPISMNPEERE
jgi:hypothetical protein